MFAKSCILPVKFAKFKLHGTETGAEHTVLIQEIIRMKVGKKISIQCLN